ncbi:uncharacterized protein LOC130094544 [Rhinichthys klamathensis goyatoka]|uniref:uncharacterized protein LOC130094544 n=1 Tax=Rhinichthys klamathensis goyatoka TaxID=3034132 RepID=UPI0024B4CEAA|nr:uncharacterized protein LOC130094544 [Rhinichthys klamathensis goyatoka]
MYRSSVCVCVCVYFTDLLIWCEAAETLTDQLTDLGQNVSINCDFGVKEVNWLLLKLPDSPVVILLSSTASAPFYYSKAFRQKYSVQSNHRLFINNVTIDDLGLYYCETKDAPPKYSDGTRIHISVPSPAAEIQNHTAVKNIERNQTHWQIIIFISALLNAVLIIVVIGLLKMFVHARNGDDLKQFQSTDLQNLQDMDFEQPQDSTQTLICYMKI